LPGRFQNRGPDPSRVREAFVPSSCGNPGAGCARFGRFLLARRLRRLPPITSLATELLEGAHSSTASIDRQADSTDWKSEHRFFACPVSYYAHPSRVTHACRMLTTLGCG
jgi:hypothetical protein